MSKCPKLILYAIFDSVCQLTQLNIPKDLNLHLSVTCPKRLSDPLMKQVSSAILLICSDKYDDMNAFPAIPCSKWPSKFLKKERVKKLAK